MPSWADGGFFLLPAENGSTFMRLVLGSVVWGLVIISVAYRLAPCSMEAPSSTTVPSSSVSDATRLFCARALLLILLSLVDGGGENTVMDWR